MTDILTTISAGDALTAGFIFFVIQYLVSTLSSVDDGVKKINRLLENKKDSDEEKKDTNRELE